MIFFHSSVPHLQGRTTGWSLLKSAQPLLEPRFGSFERPTLATVDVTDTAGVRSAPMEGGRGRMASQIDEPALIWSLIFWGVKQQDRGPWRAAYFKVKTGTNTWKGACTWKLHLYPWFTSWTIFAAISLRHYTLCFDSTAKMTYRCRKPKSQRKSVVLSIHDLIKDTSETSSTSTV